MLIIHGENDDFVDYRKVSIISKKDKLHRHGLRFETITGSTADHIRLLFSDDANRYRSRLDSELESLSSEHGGILSDSIRENFVRCTDRELANEVNENLMRMAESFFLEY